MKALKQTHLLGIHCRVVYLLPSPVNKPMQLVITVLIQVHMNVGTFNHFAENLTKNFCRSRPTLKIP